MGCISASGTGFAAPTGGSGSFAAGRLALLAGLAPLLLGASPSATLEVKIDQLRSAKGLLRVCVTADPKNFPACVDDARATKRSVPATQPNLLIEGVAPGDYAIAVIHDANGNARLDTFMGIPREGFGFSRNPVIAFGPPRFKAAAFTINGPHDTEVVTMRYLL